ncbi:ERI1 exoribonuclease 2 isoform X1 [Pogona vitticeps]
MATKRLARQLGIIRRLSKTSLSDQSRDRPKLRQLFSYLIVIDFESTCWNDNRKCYTQEIIEFPAVLLNTSNGEMESEFHAYVQPQEHPILSEFCTELTGITQNQVDEGVPLRICLSQFSKWIQKLQTEKNIIFSSSHSSGAASEGQLCAFVTWSDWDLGVCLHYECKRKQLRKPAILNSWIDLRATYKLFYSRKPQGLNNALQDVGIVFAGREHSGMDDSRNTARLAWRMIRDGCVMKITKSLDKVPPPKNSIARFLSLKATSGPLLGSKDGAETSCLEKNRKDEVATEMKNNKENQQQMLAPVRLRGDTHVLSKTKANEHDLVPSCLNLYAGKQKSSLGHFQPSSSNSLNIQNGLKNEHLISNVSADKPGLVLVPTVISTVNISNIDISTTSDCLSMLADWEDVPLISESQDDQSSESSNLMTDLNNETLLMAGERMEMNHSKVMNSASESVSEDVLNMETPKSIQYRSPDTTIYDTGMGSSKFSNSSEFKLPPPKANISSADASNCKNLFAHSSDAPKRKPSSPKYLPPAKKVPFAVYEDKDTTSSCNSSLHEVSFTVLKSSVNLNQSLRTTETGRVTPPLCKCGRRARRLSVSNGGPNHGKIFYSCPVGKQEGSKKSCGYFKWEHSLLKEKLTSPSTSNVRGLFCPRTSCSSSGNSQKRHLGLRPSMRT